jgi:hypothetical protein
MKFIFSLTYSTFYEALGFIAIFRSISMIAFFISFLLCMLSNILFQCIDIFLATKKLRKLANVTDIVDTYSQDDVAKSDLPQANTTTNIVYKAADAINPALAAMDPFLSISTSERYAWSTLCKLICRWIAYFQSATIVFIFIVAAPWARCNGTIQIPDFFVRLGAGAAIMFAIDFAFLFVEMRMIGFRLGKIVRLMERVSPLWRSALIPTVMTAAVLGVVIAAEAGLLGQSNDCFLPGRF